MAHAGTASGQGREMEPAGCGEKADCGYRRGEGRREPSSAWGVRESSSSQALV